MTKTSEERLPRPTLRRSSRWFTPLLLGAAALRLGLYLANRSLWGDEARVALNILHKSARSLLGPLEFGQVAPPGFLLLEKAAQYAFGSSEMALRLVPLLCGLASLPLFFGLARRHLRPPAALLACVLFTISEPLIYYSTELKQYSMDVTAALLLWWLVLWVDQREFRWGHFLAMGLMGGAALFFSHAALFVLGGMGLSVLFARGASSEKRRRLLGFGLAASVWAAAFGALYELSLHRVARDPRLLRFFTERLEGFPPGGKLADVRWFLGRVPQVLVYPGALDRGIAALCVLFGALALFRRDRRSLVMWLAPAAFALLAAVLRRYPFEGRLVLFVVPAIYLLVGAGFEEIRVRTRSSGRLLAWAVGFLLVVHPTVATVQAMRSPRYFEHLRPVLERVSASRRLGDVVYVYYGAQYAVRYYLETRPISLSDLPLAQILGSTQKAETDWYYPTLMSRPPGFVVGVSSRERWLQYGDQLDLLVGHPRVWVIFSHVYTWGGIDERLFFLQYLDRLGTRVEAFEGHGASAYLYDLRSLHSGS